MGRRTAGGLVSQESTTPDPVELTRRLDWVAHVIRRPTVYTDIHEGRAAAERLAEERADG